MIKLNEEYFNSPYYFFCKDKGNNIAIYFSVAAVTEAVTTVFVAKGFDSTSDLVTAETKSTNTVSAPVSIAVSMATGLTVFRHKVTVTLQNH